MAKLDSEVERTKVKLKARIALNRVKLAEVRADSEQAKADLARLSPAQEPTTKKRK